MPVTRAMLAPIAADPSAYIGQLDRKFILALAPVSVPGGSAGASAALAPYARVKQALKHELVDGAWPPGSLMPSEAELVQHCRDNLTGYKRPKFVVFRGELPKTNVGKILRRELRDGVRA